RAVRIFKVLSDPKRLKVLSYLNEEGPKSVSEIMEHLGSAQANISNMLGKLSDIGLVNGERDGRTVVYSANITDEYSELVNFDMISDEVVSKSAPKGRKTSKKSHTPAE